ncbi:MAG: hypothetical protein ACPGPF_10855, partial [Pontibacterium sp.]
MKIYLVGGAVRDQLLNYPVYDKDWVVVGATPDEMIQKGFKPVGKDFPVFLHPQTHEEYALARQERKTGKGYTGFSHTSSPKVSLEEDLLRRDLTINAMAQADDGTIIDPYHGQQDLANKLLRHVSDAFSEDPLRVLRVARFEARYAHLGFSVAPETAELMRRLSQDTDELLHLSNERVWQETARALNEDSPAAYFSTLAACGALDVLMPELSTISQDNRLDTLQKQITKVPKGATAPRFAVLCFIALKHLDAASGETLLNQLCERLRVPNAVKQVAQHLILHASNLNAFHTLDGETRFSIIQQLDLIRRPERLVPLIDAATAAEC